MKKVCVLLLFCLLVAGCATNGQSPVIETAGKVVQIVADPNVLEALSTTATVIGIAGGGAYFLAGAMIIKVIATLIKRKKKGETK